VFTDQGDFHGVPWLEAWRTLIGSFLEQVDGLPAWATLFPATAFGVPLVRQKRATQCNAAALDCAVLRAPLSAEEALWRSLFLQTGV
jgi:hypothetical protein